MLIKECATRKLTNILFFQHRRAAIASGVEKLVILLAGNWMLNTEVYKHLIDLI
jgi:hypothetical protein